MTLKTKLSAIPPQLASLHDYEIMAEDYIDEYAWHYIQGGSGNEQTLRANRTAFEHYTLRPSLLNNCSKGHTRLNLLGHTLQHPILLAPVAYQKLVHPNGETETARAAEATDTLMVSSTLASVAMEDVVPNNRGNNWFQLYFQPAREHTLDLIQRAENTGFTALMVTLDTPIQSANRRCMRLGGQWPAHLQANVQAENLRAYQSPLRQLSKNDSAIFQGVMATASTWDDLIWLRNNTRLPIVVKGVLNSHDAQQLININMDGLVISNHGGRALDASPASLDVIANIRQTLGDDIPLILDSGIRSGYDIVKALALGANAVMIGRPQLHGLAIAGALGVAHMLKLLRDELELCMALAGCAELSAIDKNMTQRSPLC